MKKFCFILLLLLAFLLVGCMSMNEHEGYSDKDGHSVPGGDSSISEGGDVLEPDGGDDNPEPVQIPAGQITASVYFDNDYYSFWQELLTSNQQGDGLFKQYTTFSFATQNRIKLTIEGVKRAKVTLLDDNQHGVYTTYTNHDGIAYLFNKQLQELYQVQISYIMENGELYNQIHEISNNETLTLSQNKLLPDLLEIMFIIDTTGSMGDEMSYLKAEIDDVISKVQSTSTTTSISVALLFYRDNGDEYVTRYFDFTNDIEAQQRNLQSQSASGGGDFEEAVQIALGEAVLKQWTSGTSTKLVIHLADAPSHDEDVSVWNEAVLKMSEMGINIITIAASGIDKKTEYFFRSQCLLTHGAYVYITNDSGLGGDHLEPTIAEEQTVEFLNSLLVRLIYGFHIGDFKEPISYKQEIK